MNIHMCDNVLTREDCVLDYRRLLVLLGLVQGMCHATLYPKDWFKILAF